MKRPVIVICVVLIACCGFAACNYFAHADAAVNKSFEAPKEDTKPAIATPSEFKQSLEVIPLTVSQMEQSILNAGLVDIKAVDSTIVVDLKYSTPDNFLCMDVYGDFDKCYLQPDVAQKLKLAQQYLKTEFPYYNLVVYDAARPRSVQRIMWDTVEIPYAHRGKFLSSPGGGSLHNFGAAVDISIIDDSGFELDMGTPYDYFGELAYPQAESRMLMQGKLTHRQLFNREILRSAMQKAGFGGIGTEWWHFNSCSRETAYQKYKIIE
ncbi:MAG: M15 family metallopeptidase [Bacteroidia bacterium]|jgi:D-alanyl-D-alanine dipeptidase